MPLIGKTARTKESVKIQKGSRSSGINELKKQKDKDFTKVRSLNGYFNDSYPENLDHINIVLPELTISSPEDWIKTLEITSGMNYDTVHTVVQEAEELVPGIALESLEKWFPDSLIQALSKKGVTNLFDFQTRAFKMVLKADDLVITAPTGTGKTEAFLLPLVARYYRERLESKKSLQMISSNTNDKTSRVRVLAIYPTKALAADQRKKFDFFMGKAGFEVATFDGDTSTSRRSKIYADPPEVIITNMDIIHYNLYKYDFQELIKNIETVIIDEIHAYEGLLGTNLKMILERLSRIVKGFQIIMASATVANAEEFASMIAGRTVKVCHCHQGRRTSVVHAMITRNMPFKQFDGFKNTQTGQSRDKKAALIVKLSKLTGAKILAFEDSRKRAEQLHKDITKYSNEMVSTAVHHGGLPAKTRKRTEDAFKKGVVRILVATPTMELGIDIGDINVIFSSPVPINRLLQRFGRGGRKGQPCLTVTDLSGDTPANVYYRQYPEEFLSSAGPVFFDPGAEMIIFYHVLAAARDLELDEGSFFTKKYSKLIQTLLEQGLLGKSSWNSLKITETGFTLLRSFNLRGIGETVSVVVKKPGTRKSTTSVITTREIGMAIQEFYPGALVLVNGQDYAVRDFDKSKRKVTVVSIPRSRKKYFTRPKVTRMIIPDKKRGKKEDLMFLTDVLLITSVDSYTRTSFGTYDSRTVDLDESLVHETTTRGLYICTAPIIDKQSRGYNREAWHGLGHLIVSFSTLVTGTRGFQDIDCDITREYLLLHEMTAGGRGIARALMKALPSILEKGLTNLEACSCLNGCPKCLYIHGCREKNKGLDKHETALLGKSLLRLIS